MSDTTTTPPVSPQPPATPNPPIHTANITAHPVTTILGALAGLTGVLASLPGGNLPSNSAGWMTLLVSIGIAVFGALAKG